MVSSPELVRRVVGAWNGCHGAFLQVRDADLEWNLFRQDLVSYEAVELGGVPLLLAGATERGAGMGILPHGMWVSLWGRIPEGKHAAFLRELERHAGLVRKSRVSIGADEFHFLPGIPLEDQVLIDAARLAGYSIAENADYVGELKGSALSAYVEAAAADAALRGWSLKEVTEAADHRELDSFLAREFPGRWYREWSLCGLREDMGRAFWNLLRNDKGLAIGFSRLALRGRIPSASDGWTPGALRLPQDEEGGLKPLDSCLGPIGMGKEQRGTGGGKILLGLSLRELCIRGARSVCIDWTNAHGYYEPLGFRVRRRYATAWKEI